MNRTCPNSEQVALYLSGRLPEAGAAAMRAHLAECEECYEVAAETATFLEEESSTRAGAVGGTAGGRVLAGPGTRRERRWRRGVLEVAALLCVIVGAGAIWWRSQRTSPGVEELLAMAPRPGHVRLADASFQPPEPTMRGGERDRPRFGLLAAAARVEEAVGRDPSPANLHALGVANLVLGEPREAVEALRRAARGAPDDPGIASDLGAALIHLGMVEGEPERIAEGVETLRDIPDGRRPAAVFNEAVGYELLGLGPQAIASWERYLALDPSSEWAEEARERQVRLRRDR